MTRKDILDAIAANPGLPLYVSHTAQSSIGPIGFFEMTSKTRMLKAAKVLKQIKIGPYISFRPDLNPARYSNCNQMIVLFCAD